MATKTTRAKSGTSAEEMRVWYEKHRSAIENFEKAQEALSLIDPKKTETRTYSVFNREKLRLYLKNPAQNYKQLIELSRFLYTRSHPYKKLIHYNMSMVDVNLRSIVPIMDMTKKNKDKNKVLKDYWATCNIMNRSNIQAEVSKMNVIAWREDTAFGVWYSDDSGTFILPISYLYAKVDSVYPDGTLGFAMDMSYFDNRQDQLEFWGEPFVHLYDAYQHDKQNGRWQHMDDDRAYVIKINIDDPTMPLPPYVPLFNSIINLADTEDLQADKDEASVYKLLNWRVEPKGDEPDDFTVDIDTAVDYFNRAVEELPKYVGAFISPVKVEPISFEKDQAADVNIIENATKNLYNSSGGAQILNSLNITTTIGWLSVLISDTEYGARLVRPQVENNINRLVNFEKKNSCRIKLLPISPYLKNMYKESLEKDFQYGVPVKLTLNTLNGFTEVETVSMAKLEEYLDLANLFQPPKSANTQSSKDVGRPENTTNPEDLTDEGDASRNKG